MKNTGSYYTPKSLASYIWTHVGSRFNNNAKISVLEPSCGDGVFLDQIPQSIQKKIGSVVAIDIEKKAINNAKKKSLQNIDIKFLSANFLKYKTSKKFDLVIGNPPYISRKHLTEEQKNICKDVHEKAGISRKGVYNIWPSFILKSARLLKDNGVLSFVLPGELLQVTYASIIQKYLLENFERIEIVTFDKLIFEGLGQDVVILFAFKKTRDKQGLFFAKSKDVAEIVKKELSFTNKNIITKGNLKWSAHILPNHFISTFSSLLSRTGKVEDYCKSCPGVVTAANDFFIVTSKVVKDFNLEEYAVPIIRKGTHIKEWVSFDKKCFDRLKVEEGRPCFLVSFGNAKRNELKRRQKQYVELGEKQKYHERYKMINREPWYNIPTVWNSEMFFFKRSHKYPKLLLNTANVCVTDSAYRLTLNNGYSPQTFVASFYNSLTLLCCELFGRYYGGGVLELTPKEYLRLPLPYHNFTVKEFSSFHKYMTNNQKAKAININDSVILKKGYNFSDGGCSLNCVNGHRYVNLFLKGIYYGQTDTAGKTQAGTY